MLYDTSVSWAPATLILGLGVAATWLLDRVRGKQHHDAMGTRALLTVAVLVIVLGVDVAIHLFAFDQLDPKWDDLPLYGYLAIYLPLWITMIAPAVAVGLQAPPLLRFSPPQSRWYSAALVASGVLAIEVTALVDSVNFWVGFSLAQAVVLASGACAALLLRGLRARFAAS